MKIYLSLFILGVVYVTTGIFISRISYKNLEEKKTEQIFDYSGVINVHSKKSSGSGSVQEIISAANEAGLDFLILNEINPLNQKQPMPIKFGDLGVFYGMELSYKNSRFLFLSHSNEKVFTSFSEIELFLYNLMESSSIQDILILAHPKKPGYEWDAGRLPKNIDAVEVINLREVWRIAWEENKINFLWSLLFYPFNPEVFFLGIYTDKALFVDHWSELGEQKIHGIIGSDATSKLRLTSNRNLKFPAYKNLFKMVQNHIVLETELSGVGDNQKIFNALKSGKFYSSIDILGSTKGFNFFGKTQKEKKIYMGESVEIQNIKNIEVKIPKSKYPLEVNLYKDNKIIKISKESFRFEPKEIGVYRVEVRMAPRFPIFRKEKWLPWIISNPIFIERARGF